MMTDAIPLGSHLVTPRTGYSHHGIYVGGGRVVHYSGLASAVRSGAVEEVTVAQFSAGCGYSIRRHGIARFTGSDIAKRARSRIGEDSYCVFSNNCEHFCEWCVSGHHTSAQVSRGAAMTTTAAATFAGLGAPGAIAVRGVVTGLSGPGIMSGLAEVGAVVGGGAIVGIVLSGSTPGFTMATLVSGTVLKDNSALDSGERKARSIGRTCSYLGATAGSVGTVATISASGAVGGLSGAGIASGLAAIGSTVGGGMASGVAIAAALPTAAAALVGYGAYRIAKWFGDACLRSADGANV